MAVEALQISDVSKSYPGVRALRNVDLNVLAGEIHGVVGENGAGKSTLMGVISGSVTPESGEVRVFGELLPPGNPKASRSAGVTIVRQEPALLPDLSVAENIYLAMPKELRPNISRLNSWAEEKLSVWSPDFKLSAALRVEDLPPEHRFIVEIARAIAAKPKILILDEPTEHLAAEDVEILFGHIRRLANEGVAVIYISHRVSEVRRISDRISVLRNGASKGTKVTSKLSEDDIITMIVGRELSSTFPKKFSGSLDVEPSFVVNNLSGDKFTDVSLMVRPGEVVGLAGIEGNGQRDFLRALAGLNKFTGNVEVAGKATKFRSVAAAQKHGIAYVAADRHREGVMGVLSVKENIALRSIGKLTSLGLVSGIRESKFVKTMIEDFKVKTPSADTNIGNLSGGNQQKSVLAGAFGSSPKVLLLDEPTQGVDVGARSEIYTLIRERAKETGMAVVILSTDAKELAGISDRVLVFSRGKVVNQLEGKKITEDKILDEVLRSTAVRERKSVTRSRVVRWFGGDLAPVAIVGLAIIILGAVTQNLNDFFLSPFSIQSMLALLVTLGLVAMAQSMVLLVGGIDLSIGPLMGLIVCAESYLLIDGMDEGARNFGWSLFVIIPLIVGSINWVLVDVAKINPMIATLVTFTGAQAVSLILRPTPDGVFAGDVTSAVSKTIGPVPIFFIGVGALALILTWVLRKTHAGIVLRATGSDEHFASLNAIKPRKVRYFAYVGASLIAGIGAITLMSQIGSGNAAGGTSYTLSSISAAVIGGLSLAGARGTFFGAIMGAALLQVATSVTVFLGLSTEWQSFLMGGLTLIAVGAYSLSRSLKKGGN
jgi:ribose transport system ATP-binding protein